MQNTHCRILPAIHGGKNFLLKDGVFYKRHIVFHRDSWINFTGENAINKHGNSHI